MLEKPEAPTISADSDDELEGMDIDLAMFLDCSKPLFQSRNPAVVLAMAKAYYHLAPAGHRLVGQELLVAPMLRLANGKRDEVTTLAWDVIASMSEERPVSANLVIADISGCSDLASPAPSCIIQIQLS